MAGADHRQDALASEWSDIVFPVGWSLQAATFSWLEEAVLERSAEAIYAGLTEHRPDVLLRSRVPTFSLPCREYAAGDWLGHGLEVSVTCEDFSVRITLVEQAGATLPFVLVAGDAIEKIRALTDGRTSMKHLSLSLAIQGLSPEMAHARFASALGLAAPEVGIASQRYLRKKRNLMESERDGFLDVAFELATGAEEHSQAQRLELTSQAWRVSGSGSSDCEDWSVLLGASLTTISSVVI